MRKMKMFGCLMATLFALSLVITDSSAHARSKGGGMSFRSAPRMSLPSAPASRVSVPRTPPVRDYGNTASVNKPSAPAGYGNSATKQSVVPAAVAPIAGYGNSAQKAVAPPASSGYGNSAKAAAAVGAVGATGVAAGHASASESASSSSSTKSTPQTPLMKKMNASYSKQEASKSLAAYEAQQAKFKYRDNSVPPSDNSRRVASGIVTRTNYRYNPTDYAHRRNIFYEHNRWNPPVYAYSSYPSFGMWDAMALWFMLDHVSDQQYASMYYHHRNDEDMKRWREEAERQAKENVELRQKLATLDQRTRALEQQGVKADPNFVPADMQQVALAEDTLKDASQLQVQPAVYKQQIPVTPVVQRQPAPEKKESHWFLWTMLTLAVCGGLAFWLFRGRSA